MASLFCLALASVVVAAGAFDDAQAFVQTPLLHSPSGSRTSVMSAIAKVESLLSNHDFLKSSANNLLGTFHAFELLPEGPDESAGSVIAKLVDQLYPNGGKNHYMRMLLNYNTAGEKANDVGFKVVSSGCFTDTECQIKEGDAVELSVKNFSYTFGPNDIFSVEMHLNYDDMPMLLKMLDEPKFGPKMKPFPRIFTFECPACGAPCKLSMDTSFPGAKPMIENIFQLFGWQHVAQTVGVNMTAVDLLGAWSREAQIQMPNCPQVLSPKRTSLELAWKLPELPQTIHPFLMYLRTVRATLTSKIAYKHADGSLIWGLDSTAQLMGNPVLGAS